MPHQWLENTPFFLKHFITRPPWWGGDLQTLRNSLRRTAVDLSAFQQERLEFPMNDGSGDTLLSMLNWPETIATDGARRPLAILIHGLTGDESSNYMLATAEHLLRLGHPVMRLNLRGAGPSRPRCRFQYHAGRSGDLHQVLMQLDGRLASQGILLVAYSLGGNMLLKYLGEQGRRAPVLGAVSVSAPIDLKATQVRFMQRRNRALSRLHSRPHEVGDCSAQQHDHARAACRPRRHLDGL